jgi:hypothetical protein
LIASAPRLSFIKHKGRRFSIATSHLFGKTSHSPRGPGERWTLGCFGNSPSTATLTRNRDAIRGTRELGQTKT